MVKKLNFFAKISLQFERIAEICKHLTLQITQTYESGWDCDLDHDN